MVCKYSNKTNGEVVKTTMLLQDPPNPKIDGGLCLPPPPPSSTSKDGVFIA